jgi:hypothetical protein
LKGLIWKPFSGNDRSELFKSFAVFGINYIDENYCVHISVEFRKVFDAFVAIGLPNAIASVKLLLDEPVRIDHLQHHIRILSWLTVIYILCAGSVESQVIPLIHGLQEFRAMISHMNVYLLSFP